MISVPETLPGPDRQTEDSPSWSELYVLSGKQPRLLLPATVKQFLFFLF